MSRARLLVFLALLGAPLALVPLATTPTQPKTLPDLAGRWRVESVLVNGVPSLPREFEELVSTDNTVEYVTRQPVVAETLSVS